MKELIVNAQTGEKLLRDMTQGEALVLTQTPEEILANAKTNRQELVNRIVVTTASGKKFDGDEKSQDRMTRAIVSMDDNQTINWVLADNTVSAIKKAELKEALLLAGAEMANIWVSVYQ